MNATTFDTLTATKRLKEAGFGDVQAEAVINLLRETREADLSNLVTKDDLRIAKEELRHEIRREAEDLRHQTELLRRDLTIRMGSMLVIAVGTITTLVKLL